jgi:hypothetical protein
MFRFESSRDVSLTTGQTRNCERCAARWLQDELELELELEVHIFSGLSVWSWWKEVQAKRQPPRAGRAELVGIFAHHASPAA